MTTIMGNAEARKFCKEYMNASKSFQACRKVPDIDSEKAIESCILDIQVIEFPSITPSLDKNTSLLSTVIFNKYVI